MKGYYHDKLSGEKLKRCYEIAPPRVRQYLEAEINHVLQKIHSSDMVLELGCGYGRVLPLIAKKAKSVIGIDTSRSSLLLGREVLCDIPNCLLVQMDAVQLGFRDNSFDAVICIQNGISAFRVNQHGLIRESIRVAKSGAIVLFSSYCDKFWKHRLEWFRLQSEAGLLGEIDVQKTKDGVIVCKDGFTATTVGANRFRTLTASMKSIELTIVEIDESSLFCEIVPDKNEVFPGK